MGGQETLLLVGRHPEMLAGAVAFDSVTDFFRRYSDFAVLGRKGRMLQQLARIEVGGTPTTNPVEYRLRGAQHWLDEIAHSGVPLQMWWSDADEIVTGQEVFDPTVYYFQERPTIIPPLTVAGVVLGAVAIAGMASVLPALRAARLHPVEAVRYE